MVFFTMNTLAIAPLLLVLVHNSFQRPPPSPTTTEIDLSFFDNLETQTPKPNTQTTKRPSTIMTVPAMSFPAGTPVFPEMNFMTPLHSSPDSRQENAFSMSGQVQPVNPLAPKDHMTFNPYSSPFYPNYDGNPDSFNILGTPSGIPQFSYPYPSSHLSPPIQLSPYPPLSSDLAPYGTSNTPFYPFLQPQPYFEAAPAQELQSMAPLHVNGYVSSNPMISSPVDPQGSEAPLYLPPIVYPGNPSAGYPFVATFIRTYVPHSFMSLPYLSDPHYVSDPLGYLKPDFGHRALSSTDFYDGTKSSVTPNIPSVPNPYYIPHRNTVQPSQGQYSVPEFPPETRPNQFSPFRFSSVQQSPPVHSIERNHLY